MEDEGNLSGVRDFPAAGLITAPMQFSKRLIAI
jgi:hypothetical protein